MEKIIYNGRIFTRDPSASTRSCRTYYRRKFYDRKTKRYVQQFLHRVIWEEFHGPIPADHIIHHIDGNSANNALENLTCILLRDHLSKYHGDGKYKNAQVRTCVRCGNSFKAKTKRSKFCPDCVEVRYHSIIETRKYTGAVS